MEHHKGGAGLVTSHDEHRRSKTRLLRNLYDHMIDTSQYSQLIILNNTDATPTIRFDGEDTTELVFGEHEGADSPGLLLGLRDDQPGTTNNEVEQLRLWDE